MPSSYYKPCKELDRCVELNKYWDIVILKELVLKKI